MQYASSCRLFRVTVRSYSQHFPAEGAMNLIVVLSVTVAIITAATATSSLSVNPDSLNITIFEQQQYQRVCRYGGPRSDIDTLQILHNGSLHMNVSALDTGRLDIMEASLSDAGLYECRIIFTDGEVEGPVSIGFLTVIDSRLLNFPQNQYVIIGGDVTLQCSFDDTNTMYGLAITVTKRGDTTVSDVRNASLADEGEYSCEVNLLEREATLSMPFALHVFTPITIISEPPRHQTIHGIQRANFSVTFTGRPTQNITATWHREGARIESNEDIQLVTTFPSAMQGEASIIIPAIVRGNSGVYRVDITTEFGGNAIPTEHKKKNATFQLEVEVLPTPPSNFRVTLVTEHRVTLQWDLHPQHPDEAADTIMLYLFFPNGSFASHTALQGMARQAEVAVFPGMRYHAVLRVENRDGTETSELYFTTHNAAPYISHFESRRLNETHFNLSLSLLYTGGGDITQISVSFREASSRYPVSREWVPISGLNLILVSTLEWNGVILGEEFRGKGPLEFEVTVENEVGFMNTSGPVDELSDPPGTPTTPTVKDPSPTSVVIDFHLPDEGTPPFIEVIIDFTEPSSFAKNFSGFYQPGQKFHKELEGLRPQTAYSLKARAVNYAGDGPDSQIITFTTADETEPTVTEPPTSASSPTWLLPAIIGGSSLLTIIVISVLVCCAICCYCRRKKKHTNVYKVEKDTLPRHRDVEQTVQELEPEHEMLQRKDKVPVILATPPSSTKTSPKIPGKNSVSSLNTYTQIPSRQGEEGAPSTTSSSPWNQKRRLENSRGSSSTLNSGSVAQQSQDSFIKKSEILSTGSGYLSLQSTQQETQSYRTSRDSLMHKRKIPNPSISSGGSGSIEMTDRYQTQSVLSPPVEETYSFASMPFIPEGPYCAEEPTSPYSYPPHNQYASDV